MNMEYYKKYEPFFGSWHITKMLGEGSFGKVFEIERQDFGETYKAALKVITVPQNESEVKSVMASGMDNANVTEYFEGVVRDIVSEFVLMSKLKGNSHVVSYEDHQVISHEDKEIGWDIIIRMELLTPLLDYAQNSELTRKDVMKLGIDICSGLELCQKHNIIHRDIKPENIFVSENGNYKLGDFGIARTIEKTSSGLSKKGTYTYMAPEVYKGEEYGSAVDIYSLGIVMYRLLNNNRNPFLPTYPEKIKHSDIDNALIRRISGEILPAPASVDGRLAEIVLKACSYNPKDRYSSPMQMRQELEGILYEPEKAKIIYPQSDGVMVKTNEYVTPDEEITPIDGTIEEGTVSIFGNVPKTLEEQPSVAQLIESSEDQRNMFCKNCGETLPRDAKFCMKCGTRMTSGSKSIKKEIENEVNKESSEVPHIIESVIPISLLKEEGIELQAFAKWNDLIDGVITLTNKRLIFVETVLDPFSGKVSKEKGAFKCTYKFNEIHKIKSNLGVLTPVASFNVRTDSSWFSSVNIQINDGDYEVDIAKRNIIVSAVTMSKAIINKASIEVEFEKNEKVIVKGWGGFIPTVDEYCHIVLTNKRIIVIPVLPTENFEIMAHDEEISIPLCFIKGIKKKNIFEGTEITAVALAPEITTNDGKECIISFIAVPSWRDAVKKENTFFEYLQGYIQKEGTFK